MFKSYLLTNYTLIISVFGIKSSEPVYERMMNIVYRANTTERIVSIMLQLSTNVKVNEVFIKPLVLLLDDQCIPDDIICMVIRALGNISWLDEHKLDLIVAMDCKSSLKYVLLPMEVEVEQRITLSSDTPVRYSLCQTPI